MENQIGEQTVPRWLGCLVAAELLQRRLALEPNVVPTELVSRQILQLRATLSAALFVQLRSTAVLNV